MSELLLRIAQETWYILKEASPFLLLGFAIAGVLAVLAPTRTLLKYLGAGKIKSVLWASAIGVPLPLCSCGVVPTALGLKRQGATPGATVAFLIATPETGVDSISLSYALMDPIITVFRPLSAMITAVTAGILTNLFGHTGHAQTPAAAPTDTALAHDHGHEHPGHDHSGHDHHHEHASAAADPVHPQMSRAARFAGMRQVFAYAFRELLDETAYWLILGIVLSGLVSAFLPPTLIERYLSSEFASMLAMLLIGIPMYTCASSSTPVAAALVLKGLNPGAALVFLLAGPATNIGSITLLLKFLGVRVVAIYLASIAAVALLAGYALNGIYRYWNLNPRATFGAGTGMLPEWAKIAGALVFLALLVLSLRRAHVPEEWRWLSAQLRRWIGLAFTSARVRRAVLATAAVLYLGSGLFSVAPGETAFKLRFGAIVSPPLEPGLHYRLPWPIESHRSVPTRQMRRVELGFRSTDARLGERTLARENLTVAGPGSPVPQPINTPGFWFQKEKVADESFLLTGDGNLINIGFTVHYRVKDAAAYAYTLADPDALVRALTLATLRGTVATEPIDAVYTTARAAIDTRVAEALQDALDKYRSGIEIVALQLLYVHAPDEVHDAFRDVASAQEDKQHIITRAQTFAIEKVNLAKGEAAALAEQALAFKEDKVLRATGEAAAFTRQLEAFQHEPDLTRFRLRLEMLEDVLPGAPKLLRPGTDTIKDFDLWLLEPPPIVPAQ
ncbi:MAG: SO_0444 family Cu/Zn efflux transporter [Gammaproteobacteria bacterium]